LIDGVPGPEKPALRRSLKGADAFRPGTVVALALRGRGVDLSRGSHYRVIEDDRAKADGFLRIVDNSGEDYLYPAAFFRLVRVPPPR
jgi:hypothetical protein